MLLTLTPEHPGQDQVEQTADDQNPQWPAHTSTPARRSSASLLRKPRQSERLKAIGRDPVRIRLPMSRIDIANYLGLALETVSRGFTRLQEEGLIDVHGRQVTVLDAATLTRLAHGMAQDEAAPPRRRPAG